MSNKVNLVVMFIGLAIMIVISINAIVDSFATDMTSSIPPTVLGAALFIAGYIKYDKK
jgi:predicted membrane channel-forming protein YqfA (hemolysin III family)